MNVDKLTTDLNQRSIVVEGINVTAINLPQNDLNPAVPEYFLKIDEMELFKSFGSHEDALNHGKQLIELEIDELIANLEKDIRRADVLIESSPTDISLPKLLKYKKQIVDLLNKLNAIELNRLETA